MQFEFATAGRIIFGEGKRAEASNLARTWGKRAFLAVGKNPARAEWLRQAISEHGIQSATFSFSGEPKIGEVEQATAAAREFRAEMIIAAGGGSVIDGAKAVAAMATNPGSLMDYLEVIGGGQPLIQSPLPYLAIPTTAGTGAEVTRNAVLFSPEHRVKVSLRSSLLLPKVAIVDPELTLDLPPEITAWTGMDALTQLIEPYVCARRNPIVDALCREGIPRVARSIERGCSHGSDIEARHEMCLASLFGGIALANAGLGAVHGFAAPIGGMYPAPHGAVCAALLAGVMKANLQQCERDGKKDILARFEDIARLLTGHGNAQAQAGIEWVEALARNLKIPGLSRWAVRADEVGGISRKAAQSSSMKANPTALEQGQLEEILICAL